MTTDAQDAANRRNAAQSTGPRTPEGRARSALNASTHGVYARVDSVTATILQEDPTQITALVNAIVADLAPRSALERSSARNLAERVVGQSRASRLSAPAINGGRLTAMESAQFGLSRQELSFTLELLVAMDVVEGSRVANVDWFRLIWYFRSDLQLERPFHFESAWDDGEPRAPETEAEWLITFRRFLLAAFDDLDDARAFGEERIRHHALAAEVETHQADGAEVARILDKLTRVLDVQTRADRGLAQAFDFWKKARAITAAALEEAGTSSRETNPIPNNEIHISEEPPSEESGMRPEGRQHDPSWLDL